MSGPALALRGLSYTYPSASEPALRGVDLELGAGELLLLTGPTGCGKSTLLRLAAGLLQRHGEGRVEGEVSVAGQDPAAMAPSARVRALGFVSQEPTDHLVAGTVGDELAFGMESAGASPQEMDAALPAMLGRVGLAVAPDRSTGALSGGQTQRLVTGAALAAGAGLLLLDEPTAQLDPLGARRLLEQLRALAGSGVAVLMVEHRLERCLPAADRLVVMEGGRLVEDLPVEGLTAGSGALATLRRLGLSVPGRLDREDRRLRGEPEPPPLPGPPAPEGAILLEAEALSHRYPRAEADALRGVSLRLRAGERVALLGANGLGKSTLLGRLSGRLDGGDGRVEREGRLVAVPQDPDLALFCPSVGEELAYGPREQRLEGAALARRVAEAAEALSVEDLLDRAPQALSRGQRLRVAVASALSCDPALLLLDEPTSGQDHEQVERMMEALRERLGAGALVFATHDLGLALRHATRVVVLHEGAIVREGPPREALAGLPSALPLRLPSWAAEELGEGPSEPICTKERIVEECSSVQNSEEKPPDGLLDPRSRLALLGCAGILAITLERPASLALFAAVCALPLLATRVEGRWWRRGALAVAAIIWSTVLSQGLFYAEQPRVALASLGPLTLWREGVVYGLAQSMRFVGLSLAGLALAVSTPPDRMYAALMRLRVPFGLALMASTALRFLPVVARELVVVREARAHRGRPTWRRGPLAWMRLEVSLLRPVVARAWRRAQNLAESLDTRGFDPLAPRAVRRPLRMRALDGLAIGAAAAVALGAAGLRGLYLLYVSEAWYHPALRGLYAWVRGWL